MTRAAFSGSENGDRRPGGGADLDAAIFGVELDAVAPAVHLAGGANLRFAADLFAADIESREVGDDVIHLRIRGDDGGVDVGTEGGRDIQADVAFRRLGRDAFAARGRVDGDRDVARLGLGVDRSRRLAHDDVATARLQAR